ncbi:MAG: DUF1801 domain-containing protein [Paracoccaceae bacterium]|nr:DUF1801 domain-containing protein [Paracoccaceae bacterium]
MPANKTVATDTSPEQFLASLPEAKRAEAERLDALFREVTGWAPVMWGPSIVGYGRYHYRYESGREGDFLATGFAPRAHGFSVYIMPGYEDFGPFLARIGKHRMGKSCLEIRRLSDIDEAVLGELVRAGLDKLGTRWSVEPS